MINNTFIGMYFVVQFQGERDRKVYDNFIRYDDIRVQTNYDSEQVPAFFSISFHSNEIPHMYRFSFLFSCVCVVYFFSSFALISKKIDGR